MLTISGSKISKSVAENNGLECGLVDYAMIVQAEISKQGSFEGCTLIPEYAIALNPADDMTIPIYLCPIHFNSFKMALHETVAIDEDLFGKLKEN